MYRFFLMIAFLYLFIALAACSQKALHKSKALESIAERPEAGTEAWIDRLQYDSKNKIAYGYFNDDNDLLIRIMATDRSTITKMFAAGFTIHFDTTGKKESQFSIKYPLAQGMQNMMRPDGRNQLPDASRAGMSPQENINSRIKTGLNEIEITGFDEQAIQSTQLNSRSGGGINAWIFVDSLPALYYELKIPLNAIFTNGYTDRNTFSIGLESGKIDLPSTGPPTGMSVRPGGGNGSGSKGQGGGHKNMQQHLPEIQTLSQAIKIWIKRIELNR
ncbi:MAG: hypothetical protein K9H16_00580 [Bacteroidales bacterium]|nr:hypothetical protein [Bacteroidales bacterium]